MECVLILITENNENNNKVTLFILINRIEISVDGYWSFVSWETEQTHTIFLRVLKLSKNFMGSNPFLDYEVPLQKTKKKCLL